MEFVNVSGVCWCRRSLYCRISSAMIGQWKECSVWKRTVLLMKNSFLLGMGDDFRVKILVPGRKHFFLIIGY